MTTPSQAARAAGLDSLKQVADMTGKTTATLINWHRDNPQLFEIVLLGCVIMRCSR